MKLDSKIFDSIRIKPDKARREAERAPICQWEGCDRPGTHKAPRGRGAEGQYLHFCIDHVRLYNKSYNYFDGMDDTQVRAYQKDALTGHRPTWKMGTNKEPEESKPFRRTWNADANDPFDFFDDNAKSRRAQPRRRKVKVLEKRSLETLNLDETADGPAIKARYKELVKQLHPDANGGDRSTEERLRQIIQAYNILRQSGLC
ncbi:DnaJ-like protein [Breoghania corrubedonensis]|uniref:DnaJ-like protein n=1 Tax=Breoghania corrubedonensis TaxID=665038 RepID=A0A2T5UWC9_9HYPH|nr:J domain-containing protein [Breoghania corrubedonensis]PTW55771.1 DnaJ-like protein [Breoghania corrubedonensis]